MIHFSHGNGFPAETYHQVIKGLGQRLSCDVGYISCLGHNPKYQVDKCWSSLVQELIDHIEQNYNDKVMAIGHSLGGVLSYWACTKRPDLFKAVLLLDSPIYSNYKLLFIKILKACGLIEYFTPAPYTKNRRYSWPSHKAAIDHFASKRVFRYFDEKCIKDYVYFGTEQVDHEVRLKFDPLIEWNIYRTIPSLKISKLPETVPCGLIHAEHSKVILESDAHHMQQKNKIWRRRLDGCGHLFPFEKPNETVDAIIDFISENNIDIR